jgi:UDP-GlcNAc:undecaprenyl-phosphate GlcNAc-1-phosphate transferase
VIVTIAWAVAIPNAVNLVDGLDGLAAGMVAIAATFFFAYVVLNPGELGPASQTALISAITAGICIGFLPWNFYPAKIFMGDAGSMLLGMLLAIATIEGRQEPHGAERGDLAATAGAIAVPFLILLIPALDVALAIVRRTRRGQGSGTRTRSICTTGCSRSGTGIDRPCS